MRTLAFVSLVCAAPLALAGPAAAQTDAHAAMALPANATDAQIIASAETAAPAAVARDATIIAMNADGTVRTVRKGSNGFTCMADSPATPGPDPMCGDANAMEFIQAWIGKKTPPNKPGFMYMLQGGTDASNTDPYAKAPTDANNWVKTGPHVMVVGSKEALAGYPATDKPDTTKPYVMWPNTPYAHLMIPVS